MKLKLDHHAFFDKKSMKKLYLTMRLTVLLSVIGLLQVSATSFSQKKNISISSEKIELAKLFEEVEKKSDFKFFFNNDDVDASITTKVNASNADVYSVLDQALSGLPYVYKVLDNNLIFVHSKKEETRIAIQNIRVSGKVTGANGEPLPGVNVIIEGTTNGTITNIDGEYQLDVPSTETNLVFSFIGFETQVIKVSDRSVINITLLEEVHDIEQVMVVAYGTAKKETFTGSAEVVNSEQLATTSSTSISSALQGRVAGVQVASYSGAAGSSASVRIRGVGSANASSAPLYVVDGVPNAPIPAIDDIESSTVLKDASAAALYGSRAANGVIVITTKKGKGKSKINLNYNHTFGWKSSDKQDLMNADQYTYKVWEGLRNKAMYMMNPNDLSVSPAQYAHDNLLSTIPYNPYYITENGKKVECLQPFDDNGNFLPGVGSLYSTDWVDEVYRTSHIDDLHLSFSNGNDESSIYGSLTYYDQEGIQVGNDYKRVDYNLNMSSKVNEIVEIGINTNGRYQEYTPTKSMYAAYVNSPTVPVYKRYGVTESMIEGKEYGDFVMDENGNKLYHWDQKTSGSERNILAERANYIEDIDNTNVIISPYISIQPFSSLTLLAKGSAKFYRSSKNYFYDPVNGTGVDEEGYNERYTNNQRTLFGFLQATFEKKFGSHNVKALTVYEAEEWVSRDVNATAKEFPMWQIAQNLDDGQVKDYMFSRQYENARISMLGQLEYGLKDKYYVSGSFRRDGSSRFGPNNRWGDFWSVGATWRISEEGFMKNQSFITSLKLRGSHGISGNDAIGNYAWQSTYTLGGKYNNISAASLDQIENLNLGWEGNVNSNIALEFRLKDRVWGTIEVYERVSDRLLMWKQMPYTTGLTSRMENVGKISNKGIEIMLGAQVIDKGDFSYETSLTLTSNKNRIDDWYGNNYNGQAYYDTGGSMFNFQMRKWAGVDPLTGHPLWYQRIMDENDEWTGKTTVTTDWNKATMYDAKDDLDGADAEPTLYGSWVNDVKIKNFDISMMFYFNVGTYSYNDMMGVFSNDGAQPLWNMHIDNYNSWNNPGDITNVPMNNNGDPTLAWWRSSRFLERSDYLKLKNLVIGYTVPSHIVKSIGLSNVRIFGMGENLWTWTNFKGYDPELNLDGQTTWSVIPPMTTVTLGVNVTF
ncbi:MAG: SusC/RagA family TonB-linked outer membrane protein [Carboxylicivirga sp.]|jgi:TonB-linked SusC/RagA family outer membrane protein|nr:SusC/RagA family TonB-linked outer membrane protein [Carboxylicivirga sp.]